MNLSLALPQIAGIALMVRDAFGDDEQAVLDGIEGQTDAYELASRLLRYAEDAKGMAGALSEQIADRAERKRRLLAREEAMRDGILAIMHAAGVSKLELAEATISLRPIPARVRVNDPDAVPDEYTVTKRTPDAAAIKAAFNPDAPLPNWLSVEPSRDGITVRTR